MMEDERKKEKQDYRREREGVGRSIKKERKKKIRGKG